MFNKLNKMLDKCDLLNYTNNIQQQVTAKITITERRRKEREISHQVFLMMEQTFSTHSFNLESDIWPILYKIRSPSNVKILFGRILLS